MKLFFAVLWISFKHSSRRLLCFFCVLFLCLGLITAVLEQRQEPQSPSAAIGVINHDENSMAKAALETLSKTKGLDKLFRLEFITPQQRAEKQYAAVITVPAGFTESVLSGENLSPTVELNLSSPLEAMWARQLAQAGANYLTGAQLGIYGSLELAGDKLNDTEYQQLVMRANIVFIKEFLNRFSLLEEVHLSISGALSLTEHYMAALYTMLYLCYAFLYLPSVLSARRLWGKLRGIAPRHTVAPACFANILLLNTVTILLPALLFMRHDADSTVIVLLLLFSLLVSSFTMLAASISRSEAACAAGSLLLCLGLGLFSGCIVPLALMPPVFESIAPFTPTGQGLRLISKAFSGGSLQAKLIWPPLAMSAVMLGFSLFLWRVRESRERGGGK